MEPKSFELSKEVIDFKKQVAEIVTTQIMASETAAKDAAALAVSAWEGTEWGPIIKYVAEGIATEYQRRKKRKDDYQAPDRRAVKTHFFHLYLMKKKEAGKQQEDPQWQPHFSSLLKKMFQDYGKDEVLRMMEIYFSFTEPQAKATTAKFRFGFLGFYYAKEVLHESTAIIQPLCEACGGRGYHKEACYNHDRVSGSGRTNVSDLATRSDS